MQIHAPEPPASPVVTSHRVRLNGAELADVFMADTDTGFVATLQRDVLGNLIPAGNGYAVNVHTGVVTAEPLAE